eukprot:11878769-Ditylum_brightwellii.AAC.1
MMPMFDKTEQQRTKPCHLLGIANERSILGAISTGIDTFNSCYPTRLGHHGTLLTKEGQLNVKSSKHA